MSSVFRSAHLSYNHHFSKSPQPQESVPLYLSETGIRHQRFSPLFQNNMDTPTNSTNSNKLDPLLGRMNPKDSHKINTRNYSKVRQKSAQSGMWTQKNQLGTLAGFHLRARHLIFNALVFSRIKYRQYHSYKTVLVIRLNIIGFKGKRLSGKRG